MESQIFSLHWLGYASLIACGANGLLKIFTFTIDGVYIIYTNMCVYYIYKYVEMSENKYLVTI